MAWTTSSAQEITLLEYAISSLAKRNLRVAVPRMTGNRIVSVLFSTRVHTKFNLVPLNSRTRVEKFQRVADFLLRYMYELFELYICMHGCMGASHTNISRKIGKLSPRS